MGKKLKAIRAHMGLTQEAMSAKLGFKTISLPQISEYENGKREPPYPVLLRYAEIAQCSTDVLIDDQQDLP